MIVYKVSVNTPWCGLDLQVLMVPKDQVCTVLNIFLKCGPQNRAAKQQVTTSDCSVGLYCFDAKRQNQQKLSQYHHISCKLSIKLCISLRETTRVLLVGTVFFLSLCKYRFFFLKKITICLVVKNLLQNAYNAPRLSVTRKPQVDWMKTPPPTPCPDSHTDSRAHTWTADGGLSGLEKPESNPREGGKTEGISS